MLRVAESAVAIPQQQPQLEKVNTSNTVAKEVRQQDKVAEDKMAAVRMPEQQSAQLQGKHMSQQPCMQDHAEMVYL